MTVISIAAPDDWHVHFRDKVTLQTTVNITARYFARALVMPNLNPPITTIDTLLAYKKRILSVLPDNSDFTPYFSLYLQDNMTPETILSIKKHPEILGFKLYPKGATTNSAAGVTNIKNLYPLFAAIQDCDSVLQIHGEVTYGDIFHREEKFIDEILSPILANFPRLRVVLEHISTKKAVEFIENGPETLKATVTAHHLLYNRNDLLAGGIRPHYYCLPILKSADDQAALKQAVVSGSSKFFAGTDSAPHPENQKESACGCAGIFSAPVALQLYSEVFYQLTALEKLEGFLSKFGAEFYKLPINKKMITLKRQKEKVATSYAFDNKKQVIPLLAGKYVNWRLSE